MHSKIIFRMVLVWLFCATGVVQPALLNAAAAPETPDKGDQKPAIAVPEVTLDSIYPTTVYPNPFHKRYDFEIVGQNFGRKAEENIVEVIGKGPAEMEIVKCPPKELQTFPKPCLIVPEGMEGRKLSVLGFQPDPYKGPVEMRVRVKGKDKESDKVSNSRTVTFAAYSQQAVFFMALASFIVLGWIIVRVILWKGVGNYEIQGKTYGPFASFFLDKQSDTYSLSKFQLLAWTSVSVFGYLYLFLCRVLIQWKFEWPNIPDGLPLLLGLSAGTAVLSNGITTSFGSKGSGAVHPSPADFISTGGMVVGERFQFFVWTLIGCLGFLFLLMRTDPAALTELPKVPDNFLYLMGFSSAGYLGGKAVRKAGPVIKSISIPAPVGRPPDNSIPEGKVPRGPVLALNLKGENLDPRASVKVDGNLLRSDQFWINAKQPPEPPANLSTEVDVNLGITLIDETTDKPLLEGEHTLTLLHADGQAADVHFPVDPMSVDSIENMPADPANANAKTLKVKGKNFGENTKAEWQGATISADQVTRTSATELLVRLPPNAAGQGKLTLISPLGLKASKEANIS